MPEAFCGFEIVRKCVLLNLWVLWEIIHPSDLLGCHLIARVHTFSHRITQMNRTHSISQSPCRRQNSQNLTANFSRNALCSLYAEGVLWARNVRQKAPWTLCALWEKKFPMNKRMRQKRSVKSVSSVRDNTSQWFAWVSSHSEGAYFFSQNNTDEQNTQYFTETLSQPISQSVTATFSYNVLWILYAGGLLWVRNSAQKGSVKSVSSVREKPPRRVS